MIVSFEDNLKNEYYQNDGSFESKRIVWFHRHRKFDPDCYGIDMAKLED
jgi:hypothetical protein